MILGEEILVPGVEIFERLRGLEVNRIGCILGYVIVVAVVCRGC